MLRRGLGAALLCAVLLVAGGPALAQDASPTPKSPVVEGEVTGGLERGSKLSFAVDATMPGGWEALHLVEIVVRSGDNVLERMNYDIEDVQLTVGEQEIVVGTGGVAAGEVLSVSGAEVVVTTGAGHLSFEVTADVLQAIPDGTKFDLGVVDDFGASTGVTRGLAKPPSEGLTWGTVVAAILVALLAGSVIGNVFASKRRPPPRLSVYGTIDRRLRSERESSSGG